MINTIEGKPTNVEAHRFMLAIKEDNELPKIFKLLTNNTRQ